jgi:xylulokinase
VPTEKIRLGGGGARSALWRQIQSDVYGQPVEVLEAEEGPAYGAALLAGVGSGLWSSVDEACEATVRVKTQIDPDKSDVAIMDRQYEMFRSLYPALRSVGVPQPLESADIDA